MVGRHDDIVRLEAFRGWGCGWLRCSVVSHVEVKVSVVVGEQGRRMVGRTALTGLVKVHVFLVHGPCGVHCCIECGGTFEGSSLHIVVNKRWLLRLCNGIRRLGLKMRGFVKCSMLGSGGVLNLPLVGSIGAKLERASFRLISKQRRGVRRHRSRNAGRGDVNGIGWRRVGAKVGLQLVSRQEGRVFIDRLFERRH
jgi:hypothetical protein